MKKVSTKKVSYFLAALGAASLMTITGCKKSESAVNAPAKVTPGKTSLDVVLNDLKKIKSLGFDPLTTQIIPGGYRVEGDIVLTKKNLDESYAALSTQQGQYSTKNPISLVRTINVALYNPKNTAIFNTAFDSTVSALNNLKIPLKFVKVTDTTKADVITLFSDLGGRDSSGVTLGQDGQFVDSKGNPGKHIALNSNPAADLIDSTREFITGVISHEFGHAIGLRHTDYQNRFYSELKSGGYSTSAANQDILLTALTKQVVDSQLGKGKWDAASSAQRTTWKNQVVSASFGAVNEGNPTSDPNAAASHIYGTPLTPTYGVSNPSTDPLSIMLAFTGKFGNFVFSPYDNIALFGIYGNPAQTALIRQSLSETGTVTASGMTLQQVVDAAKKLNSY